MEETNPYRDVSNSNDFDFEIQKKENEHDDEVHELVLLLSALHISGLRRGLTSPFYSSDRLLAL